MSDPAASPELDRAARRRRWRRTVEDALLLPLALVLEFLDRIIWRGTKALLELISRLPAVARLRRFLQGLPPLIVVFLFLIPEVIDHLSGFWATLLFVKGNWLGATAVAIFVKGFAILLAIWIYQSCEASLMSVRWFATAHDKALAGRDWVLARTAPVRNRLRAIVRGGASGRLARRLAAWRLRLARMAGFASK
ncbi:hypothetical protein AiwAL_10610 [Acidiphilium sp. AL]|uniref:Transmembrane protein n=1 Tax=Acidiphilium iwatense TaxID=768198 RepID=A0ABS9DQT1_9PROT|nr:MULTISPECIES: hypothetical protein [Acidiphilium]MCF3945103.1 hypothetical protein [Acidiphilium iwatense]MCU4160552.1 hypothetical protein [Acidiphilium sp. AL]